MRKIITILICTLIVTSVNAQSFYDCTLFGSQQIMGTARYVGMAGAMTSLGGDPSAVKDNPAGLGVFRHDEISVTGDWTHDALIVGVGDKTITQRPHLSQVSLVFALHLNDKQKGMPYCNFMLGYQRLRNFRMNTYAQGTFPVSQTDLMALNTDGLVKTDFATDPWSNQDIGWLSVFGVTNNLISPREVGSSNWVSLLAADETVISTTDMVESGSVDEYAFSWGGNISNKVYIGLGINLRTLTYNKSVVYTEAFETGGNYTMKSTFSADGLGVNGNIGIIYRPVKLFRIGASFQTPSAMTTKFNNSVFCDDIYYDNAYSDNLYQMPLRSTFGFAFQIRNFGLISAEYDYAHQVKKPISVSETLSMQDQHMFKLGTEWIAAKHCFMHVGYAFTANFSDYANLLHPTQSPTYFISPSITSTRTDTEYILNQSSHIVSAGVGYHGKSWIVDAAYQCSINKADFYPFAQDLSTIQTLDYSGISHRVVFTVAWQHSH